MESNVGVIKNSKAHSRYVFAFFYTIIILGEMALMSTMDVNGSSNYAFSYSVLILFNLLLQTFVLYRTIGLVNFFYLFVVFYYVFHFGQVIMLGIFPWYEYDYDNYVETYMSRNPAHLKDTLVLCVNCINIFVLGALLAPPIGSKKRINREKYDYKKICKVTFFILFGFRIALDAVAMFVSFYLGYSGTWETILPGVFSALGVMGYCVIPVYYSSLEGRKKKRFLIFIVIYLLFTMLSGHRGHQTICLAGLMIVYLLQRPNKIGVKNAILMGLLLLVGLKFLDFIFDLRAEGLNAYLNNGLSKGGGTTNIILETIGTFGETIFTPYLVLENYKSISPFWGECFIKSIATIVPDITGDLKDNNNEAIFARMVGEGHTIGGSFAGEMFYNFGNSYYIPTLLIGMFFSRLSDKVSYFIKNERVGEAFLPLSICVIFLWWVRDSIGNITREIVWLFILFAILKSIFKFRKA